MRKKHNTSVYQLILSLVFVFCASTKASLLSFDPEEIPEYDYSQTDWIILYGKNDYVVLGNPFQNPAPSMGVLVYEMILLYVPHMQAFQGLPEEPTHIMDLTMKDIYEKRRLGQRLFVGDPWISDGKSLTLMKPEDYQVLTDFLRKRYEGAESYDVKLLENLRRPKKSELPDDWQPEKPSVKVAIERMEVSDYERYGYDPGAAIRRQWNNDENEISTETVTDGETQLDDSVTGVQAAPINVEDQGANPAVELSDKSTVVEHSDLPSLLPDKKINGETDLRGKSTEDDETQKQPKFFPVLLMLLGLLFLTLILRKKR
jgi:hypothetical protein